MRTAEEGAAATGASNAEISAVAASRQRVATACATAAFARAACQCWWRQCCAQHSRVWQCERAAAAAEDEHGRVDSTGALSTQLALGRVSVRVSMQNSRQLLMRLAARRRQLCPRVCVSCARVHAPVTGACCRRKAANERGADTRAQLRPTAYGPTRACAACRNSARIFTRACCDNIGICCDHVCSSQCCVADVTACSIAARCQRQRE
jgi:hypothetical protein